MKEGQKGGKETRKNDEKVGNKKKRVNRKKGRKRRAGSITREYAIEFAKKKDWKKRKTAGNESTDKYK